MGIGGKYKCSMIFEEKARGIALRRYGTMELYQDENQLKGRMFPTFFWLNSPFRCGVAEGNAFSFTVHFATPCQQFSLDIEGVVDGDRITGTAENPLGAGTYILEGVRVSG